MASARESGTIEVSSAKLYFESEGSGPSLVLLNASKLDLRMWEPQVPGFSQHFQTVRYDQVGFGRSLVVEPPSQTAYSAAENPATDQSDLLALLDRVGVRRVHLLGLEAGANLAIDFALAYPNRVNALVLASIPQVWGSESNAEGLTEIGGSLAFSGGALSRLREIMRETAPLARSMLQSGDISPLVNSMLEDPTYGPTGESEREFLRRLLLENADAILHSRGRTYSPDFSIASRLKGIVSPTLVLYPKEGDPIIRENARLLEKEISGARSKALSGASRYINLEDPQGFEQAVLDFLED